MIHRTAEMSRDVLIGKNVNIWNNVQVREGVSIGNNVNIGKNTYVDKNVTIGNGVKIQNNVNIYDGVEIADDVFIGPSVTFTNDRFPRAFDNRWNISKIRLDRGCSIGANSTIVAGVTVGEFAMVGAGSVVTKDVEPYTLVYGNPAKKVKTIDKYGNKLKEK